MPFGPYRDFNDCVARNRDKQNPKGYCGAIKRAVEGSLAVDTARFPVDLVVEFKGSAVGVKDIPRDYHGRWCKGVGCDEGTGAVIQTSDPAVFAKISPTHRITAPDEWFAPNDEFLAARDHAEQKARDVPKPTKLQIAANKRAAAKAKAGKGRAGGELRGNSTARRERGEALFEEFGGHEHGYVPCVHCGIKVSPGGRGGHAAMEQDKILTLNEGGKYGTAKSGFPNLIPSCAGCNKHRGETPFYVRPKWETPSAKKKRGLAAAASGRSLVGEVVVGFPLNWDDPEADGLGTPVQGVLMIRTVDTWFGPYEQWIVGGEIVDPDSVKEPDALVAAVVPDGATVRAMAVGWDGRLTDDTDWALDRTDLPLLTVQIGTLVVTHVDDLEYDQYSVNGVPVDPHTIQPVTLGIVASVCDNCGLPRDVSEGLTAASGPPHGNSPMWKPAFGGKDVPRDYHGKWCKGAQCQAMPPKPGLSLEEAGKYYALGIYTEADYATVLEGWQARGFKLSESEQKLLDMHKLNQPLGAAHTIKVADPELEALLAQEEAIATITHTPGITVVSGTPGALPGSKIVTYETMTPGQKAAYTKKQNALKKQEAAKKEQIQAGIDKHATKMIDNGQPLLPGDFEGVSDSVVDHYIETNFPGTKGPSSIAGADERRKFMAAKNQQHFDDIVLLETDAGYSFGSSGGPRESRRAVLRETGQRRITGGPKSDTTHEFLTDSQIDGMSKEKLTQVAAAHTGGYVNDPKSYANDSIESLRIRVAKQNAEYKLNVEQLQAKGYADDQIPRSAGASKRVLNGSAPGFQHDGKYGPTVAPHGPLAPKPVVTSAINASVAHTHPAGWETWGPGKKAAWTKAHGGKAKIALTVPHPAEWDSWSPGKKAAWTKKHKVGAVTTTHAPLGEHITIHTKDNGWSNGGSHEMDKAIKSKPSPQGSGKFKAQHSEFQKTLGAQDSAALYAVDNYAGSGYTSMNSYLRYGHPQSAKSSVDNMKRAYKYAPADQPSIVERGKWQSKEGFKELGFQVGGVYEEKGFMSTSVSRGDAGGFGQKVYMRINTNGVKAIPGNGYENEWIYPPGTKYRVLSITDAIQPDGQQYRYLEVELIP